MCYAPTWIELLKLKKLGVLTRLRGPARDMTKPIHTADGKDKPRIKPRFPPKLRREMRWVEDYIGSLFLSAAGTSSHTDAVPTSLPLTDYGGRPDYSDIGGKKYKKSNAAIEFEQENKSKKKAVKVPESVGRPSFPLTATVLTLISPRAE
jgi:hypothetical protein